jgi:hypothetical protein
LPTCANPAGGTAVGTVSLQTRPRALGLSLDVDRNEQLWALAILEAGLRIFIDNQWPPNQRRA